MGMHPCASHPRGLEDSGEVLVVSFWGYFESVYNMLGVHDVMPTFGCILMDIHIRDSLLMDCYTLT
jgi:hypothetical protein